MMMHLMKYAGGNPGALILLMDLMNNHPVVMLCLVEKLDKIPSLRGDNLYVLLNDLCYDDKDLILKLLTSECPDNVLADACSRQDYSGRDMVKQYLK